MFKGLNLKLGLVAVLILGGAALSSAQSDPRAEFFALQVGRFEGTYSLSGVGTGQMTVRKTPEGTEWTVTATVGAKDVQVRATSSFDLQDKKQKATLTIDGKPAEGTAMVVGKDLVVEARTSSGVQRLRLRLSGRTDGELTLTQQPAGGDEKEILTATAHRTS